MILAMSSRGLEADFRASISSYVSCWFNLLSMMLTLDLAVSTGRPYSSNGVADGVDDEMVSEPSGSASSSSVSAWISDALTIRSSRPSVCSALSSTSKVK